MADDPQAQGSQVWRFFRAGGFDQVRIETWRDAADLAALDQKLWVALACPTRGIEFDERTLDMIDADRDGRIRAPDLSDAVAWLALRLGDGTALAKPGDELPLAAISDARPEGRALRASAETILAMLGKPGAAAISLRDTLDIEHIYDNTPFNGDGIVTAASAGADEMLGQAIADIIACLGAEPDRSHLPGISRATADKFFTETAAYLAWHGELAAKAAELQPLGAASEAAGALVAELRGKLDDFFARVRLAGYDARAAALLDPPLAVYEAMAPQQLAAEGAAIEALPLARIEAGAPLALGPGLNPAWAARIGRFKDMVVTPLLGARDSLAEAEWTTVKARFAAWDEWRARQPATAVAGLGLERLAALARPAVKAGLDALLAQDEALAPQMNAIADCEKLLRLRRDLLPLLNNFVAFHDFYTRAGKASFQAGTLYLDGRSCELCIRVEDEAKHAPLAALSRIYLAYCRCVRDGGKATMTIAAAVTAGGADNLRVGRNGVFYDRKGVDWDATIVKIVEHPISLRQAFWLPYKQFARMIGEQVQKFAAARSAAAQTQMSQAVAAGAHVVQGAPAAAPAAAAPAQQQQAFDAARYAGIFAAIGLAIGAIGTAIASVVTGFFALAWWQMPLAVVGIVLIVSGPSCLIAALKLRGRNLGPLLDASGWAVNSRLRLNLPFGRTLTALARLPADAERSLDDPYAEKRHPWGWYLLAVLVLAAGAAAWWWRR